MKYSTMKFLNRTILLSVAAFAALTAAVAVPAPALLAEALSTEVRNIEKRGGDFTCSSTGEGYCNFAINYAQGAMTDSFAIVGIVFDRYCREISSKYTNVKADMNIYSELPWVVLMKYVNGGPANPSFAFRYSTQYITDEDCFCETCSSGLTARKCCRCAFQC